MKHYESLIIGHITMDHDTDYLGNETLAIGGAVIYSSASAYALGHKVAALTKINPDDSERLTYFTIPKEDIYCIMSESSCTMDNQYFTADKERRKCMCISVGTPFTIDDIPEDVEADIYHFAGLLYGDFTNEMII
ncbi:MAG: ribokinase, partial [Acutalibacteraceae bacterium]|nr:ribokinase [Acutalibacteraceae bacterium]